jgi:hypothetical protein
MSLLLGLIPPIPARRLTRQCASCYLAGCPLARGYEHVAHWQRHSVPGKAVIAMTFFVGALLGILAGGAVCTRYLRQEVAAEIRPRLRRIQSQLENVEAEINLVMATQLAELTKRQTRPDTTPPDE